MFYRIDQNIKSHKNIVLSVSLEGWNCTDICPTINITRTAWAVFKYCGTKTVPLRRKKNDEKIDLKFKLKETTKIRGKK